MSVDRDKIYFRRVGSIYELPRNEGDRLFWAMDQLNTKSSGLLQHVSIMVAVISVLMTSTEYQAGAKHQTLLLELIAYVALALVATRCIFTTSPNILTGDNVEKNHRVFLSIYANRRKFYIFTLTANAVMVILFLGAIAAPEALLNTIWSFPSGILNIRLHALT